MANADSQLLLKAHEVLLLPLTSENLSHKDTSRPQHVRHDRERGKDQLRLRAWDAQQAASQLKCRRALFPSAQPRQHLHKSMSTYTGRTARLCGNRCFPWCPMHALHTFSHTIPTLLPTCTYSSRSCRPVTSGAPSHTTRSAGWPSKCEITCSHSEQLQVKGLMSKSAP